MMRVFFIVALLASLVYCVVAFSIAATTASSRNQSFVERLQQYNEDSDAYSFADAYEEAALASTKTGGILSLIFMAFTSVIFLMALLKIKTKAMKIISIIGLSLSGLFMLWAILPAISPGNASFDEIGRAFGAAGIAIAGLHVAGMIQAFKYKS